MKNIVLIVTGILIAPIAYATPFILVQAEEVSAILADSKSLSSGSSVLSAIKLVNGANHSLSLRTYEVETIGFDSSEPICKILAEVEFFAKDPACLPPPGGRCDGAYVVRVVEKSCDHMLQ